MIGDMSTQMEECDKTVTMMVKYGCGKCEEYTAGCDHSKFCEYYKGMEAESCDERVAVEDWKTVEEYFKNYDDDDNDNNHVNNTEDKGGENIERCDDVDVEEDDFEKL
jgi:hypothetical protein